jgi:predicted nuclease of predicted toxin-antitoxin system
MKLRDFPLFADENLFRGIVKFLRSEGFDVKFVREEGLEGRKDIDLLPIATREGRLIVTQDHDFGQIVFTQGIDFVGIIHLRPGHFPPDVHIKTIQVLLEQNPDLTPPFFLIAEHKKDAVRIKIREIQPGPSK